MKIILYLKECSHCGLLYFGKTIRSDFEKYKGSGHFWLRHIKKYGRDKVITKNIWEFTTQDEASAFALNYSKENNIVTSEKYANLIIENGLDGNSSEVITDFLREKFSIANKGTKNPSYGKYWWTDGVNEVKCVIPPEGFIRGRSPILKNKINSTKITNNTTPQGSKNPKFNNKKFNFKNIETNQIEELTQYELRIKYNLNKRALNKLVNNKRKSPVNGWIIF